MTSILILSITMMFLKHPISMSTILIIQTMTIALYMGYATHSFFISYLLIIMMLSGTLVLFMYMSSIASNEMFKPSIKMAILIPPIYWLGNNDSILLFSGGEMNNKIFDYPQSMNMLNLFSNSESLMTLTLVIYLFMTMIVVSKIVSAYEGPMRLSS